MNVEHRSPPHMSDDDHVILFDGVCKLCNAWVRFVIRHDKNRVFKFASMQSDKGHEILNYFNMPTTRFETMLYAEKNSAYEKSTAFLKIAGHMPFPARMLSWFKALPVPLLDFVYNRIARNRYKLFGKYEQCILPSEQDKGRFL